VAIDEGREEVVCGEGMVGGKLSFSRQVIVCGEGRRSKTGWGEELGKETDYKHPEHGLEFTGPQYATKSPGTSKGRLYTMALTAITTVTFNERGTRARRGDTALRR